MLRIPSTKKLRFGTSGLRDLVENMTDKEVYVNTAGFLEYLKDNEGLKTRHPVALAGDYRSSTERILKAVATAISDCGFIVDYCGHIPSPALIFYGMQNQMPSIMVTGSHIPDNRNGVKFAKASGEILKNEEQTLLACVEQVRSAIEGRQSDASLFDNSGYFKEERGLPKENKDAADHYCNRYLSVFPDGCLKGSKIVVYQHSAVGRDMLTKILESLGAETVAPHETIPLTFRAEDAGKSISCEIDLRSKKFVPVDTEKVTPKTKAVLQYLKAKYAPDFIVSMDGDSDRPLIADEQGCFLPGDQLGLICLTYLSIPPDKTFLALPVSTNDGVLEMLKSKGYTVHLTKIGSPYIVSKMIEAATGSLNRQFAYTVGWEANGGFLLGSPLTIGKHEIKALPTRDAMLPILSVILQAKRENMPASKLFKKLLLPRFTVSAVIDNATPGLEHYTSDLGQKIINRFSPGSEKIISCTRENDQFLTEDANGTKQKISTDEKCWERLCRIWKVLEKSFIQIELFRIHSVNFLDGIRVEFKNPHIVYHLRPSGNAPEFRSYVTANSQEEAEKIIQKRTKLIRSLINSII